MLSFDEAESLGPDEILSAGEHESGREIAMIAV
jgi:hypothetical protein